MRSVHSALADAVVDNDIIIRFDNVYKTFGDHNHVLQGVSLAIMRGKNTVIMGRSGSGKSVLLKTVLGLITIDKGTIHIEGTNHLLYDRFAFFNRFGMLFQGGALFDSLNVWQNVAFRLLQGKHKMHRADAYRVACEKLERVGLSSDVAYRYPAELSGGMQKRVSLARAIATNPDIIFFDEPTTGLDPIMSATINRLIRDITTDTNRTAITITHDMNSTRTIADNVAFLKDGVIEWYGTVDAMDKTENPNVQDFVCGRAESPYNKKDA